MKEILSLLAEYNRTTNETLLTLLESDPKVLAEPTGSYYGSILGVLNHVLSSDVNWLRGFRDGQPAPVGLNDPALDVGEVVRGKQLFPSLEEYRSPRRDLDDLFVRFVAANDEDVFRAPIGLTRRGQVTSFPFGKVLMHVFNHQTHHRGAIAQILDAVGVENDFSNLHQMLLA